MDDLWPWIEIGLRWFHVIAAIFWIGTTLYLSRQSRNLVLTPNDPDRHGSVVAIHSGAVWVYDKRRTLPSEPSDVALMEANAILAELTGEDPEFEAEARQVFGRDAYEIDAGSQLPKLLTLAAKAAVRA